MKWIVKDSKMHESRISHDNLLITDTKSRVKKRVQKILLECSVRQFHNELVDSPDDGGLLGDIHAHKNYVIFSDKMICSSAPPQLSPMTDNHKMMCGCAICNN